MTVEQDPKTPGAASPGPDPSPADQRRLCAFSRCRQLLPAASGPGNRARYCQDGKTWGTKGLTCKQAGHAEELLASLREHDDDSLGGASELAGHLAEAIEPATRLVAALRQVHTQLTNDVAVADRERDAAARDAAEQRGLRAVAEEKAEEAAHQAADARTAAAAAEQARGEAEVARDRAVEACREAERVALRAETQRDDAHDQARRAEARAEAAASQSEDLQRRLAATLSELSAVRDQLSDERRRGDDERRRADELSAAHETTLAELRQAHDEAREQERQRAATHLQQAVEEHERNRRAEAERHARDLADAHRQLGGHERGHADAVARAEAATATWSRRRTRLRAIVDEWDTTDAAALRTAVAELLEDEGPKRD